MNTPTNLVTLKFETAKGHNWQLTPFDLDASQEIVAQARGSLQTVPFPLLSMP